MSVVEKLEQGIELSDVVVRFAGDSGDGMQLTGNNFTEATALYGNDLATFPDFPAEIRAPAGATFGVSAFQIYFGSEDVTTAGDDVDVLVVMNPAALITNLKDLVAGGVIIADADAFTGMFFQVGFTGDVDRYGFGTSTGQLFLQNRDDFRRHACRNWTSCLDLSSMGKCSDGMVE